MDISLVIPSYKQAKSIVANLRDIILVLKTLKSTWEIIVVIDGDIDNTETVLQKAKLPNTVVVSFPKNHGKAYALREGFKRARGGYVMFLDAGGEIDPSGIPMLLEHMKWYEADIIVGSKRHPASKVFYPLKRKIYSEGYYYLTRLLFNLKVRDTQAGIKIFNARALKVILPKLVEKKFAGDLEMLVAAKKNGFHNICEAPIKMNYSEDRFSSAVKLDQITGIFIDTLAIWYRANVLKWYNR